jgi:hypothetical protein
MLDKSSYHTKAYIIGKLKSKNRNCQIKYNCWFPQGSVLDTSSCVLSFSGYTRILDIAISTEEWQNSNAPTTSFMCTKFFNITVVGYC